MSDNITVEISIPCDDEGYVLLRCSHCGELFKITASDAKDDEVLDIYCPACGLTSESYLTDDVIALANAKINNFVNDMIYDTFKKMERHNKRNSPLQFKAGKKPKHEYESPLYSTIDALEETGFCCCKRSAKVNPLLKMSACYCPFCGVIKFEDE